MNKYLSFFLCLFLSGFQTIALGDSEYIIGRAPQISSVVLLKEWTPLIEYLNQQTKFRFKLKVYEDREDFESDLKNGVLDFFYGNPGYAVIGHIKHGYTPLVRSNKKSLQAIVVARRDSGISSLAELQGKTLVFPDATAFAASLYLQWHLKTVAELQFTPEYTSGHDNVYRAVAAGRFIAGGGVIRTLEREPKELQESLKIIYTSPGMAPHPLSVHPHVSNKASQAVLNAVLQLDESEEGKRLLKQIKIQQPVKANYELDYKPIEKLAVDMYEDLLN